MEAKRGTPTPEESKRDIQKIVKHPKGTKFFDT
jgi:hypothetical protein